MASEKKMEYKWYVVRGISGQEKKVKTYIENELLKAGLSEYVPEVLIPMEKVYQIKNGKKTSKERNLFPGYILIQANLTGEVPSIITGINGVVGFLGPKDMPTPLRQSEVNRMLGTVDEQTERGETMLEPFIVGETVKVNDGPFSGFSGVIEEVHEE
ncbi:MAG: KOW motif-containing protein, partial [Bacteroidota bacterium]|nr:KOW motif-containing protein [Bacteroidota bacterium]